MTLRRLNYSVTIFLQWTEETLHSKNCVIFLKELTRHVPIHIRSKSQLRVSLSIIKVNGGKTPEPPNRDRDRERQKKNRKNRTEKDRRWERESKHPFGAVYPHVAAGWGARGGPLWVSIFTEQQDHWCPIGSFSFLNEQQWALHNNNNPRTGKPDFLCSPSQTKWGSAVTSQQLQKQQLFYRTAICWSTDC